MTRRGLEQFDNAIMGHSLTNQVVRRLPLQGNETSGFAANGLRLAAAGREHPRQTAARAADQHRSSPRSTARRRVIVSGDEPFPDRLFPGGAVVTTSDGIRLRISKQEVRDLPPVDVVPPGGRDGDGKGSGDQVTA
jgi:hypothetical protein